MKIEQDHPIKIGYILADEYKDKKLQRELEKYLVTLQPTIHWNTQLIPPGESIEQVIDDYLKTSHIILLLISQDFLVSEHCMKITEKVINFLEKDKGEREIIPILLRPAYYENAPFARLSLLPSNTRPITSWPKRENALLDILNSLSKVIEKLRSHPNSIVLPKSLLCVPYERNIFFTGREVILSRIANILRPSQNSSGQFPSLAISGLSGIGKTQTALEYVYRYQDEYQAILWIRTDSQEMLQKDLLAVTQTLNMTQAEVQSSMAGAVQSWLRNHNNWLLVFDNLEDIAVIKPVLPIQRTGSILITTHAKALGSNIQRIDLEQMTVEDGITFLLRRTNPLSLDASLDSILNSKERQSVEAIVRTMEGLPLALDQAGGFIEEIQCNFETYHQLFQQRQIDLLQWRGHNEGTHPDPIATTLSLAFSKFQQINSPAIDFLSLCAFLDPESIPEDIFTIGAEKINTIIDMQNPLTFHETIGILLSYSLIQRNPDHTLTLHRLVQTILKQYVGQEKQLDWAKCAVELMNRVFPKNLYEEWNRSRDYLPHALECVSHIDKYHIRSLEAAELLYKVGLILYSYARYKEVEPLYLNARTITEEILGREHAFTITILNELANVYYMDIQYEKAEEFFLLALTTREKALGLEHLDTGKSLNDLAQLYYSRAKYKEAELLHVRALTIREKILGPNDVVTADSLHHLGILYHAQKRYEEAEPLYQRALAIQEQVLGTEHPETLDSLDCLARLHHDKGHYSDLEPLYQRILTTRKKILGSEHPHTAISMDNLAWFYRDQKRYEEAEALHKEAWEIRKKRLHAQHPNIAVSLDFLAITYRLQGNYSLAEKFYKEALSLREKVKGLNHPYTLQSVLALASLYFDQGQYNQAELFYQQNFAVHKENLGVEHPHTIAILQNYANFLRKLQRSEEANYIEATANIKEKSSTLLTERHSAHPQRRITKFIKPQPLIF